MTECRGASTMIAIAPIGGGDSNVDGNSSGGVAVAVVMMAVVSTAFGRRGGDV